MIKLNIEVVENGFIVNKDQGIGVVGKMWVFSEPQGLATFVKEWAQGQQKVNEAPQPIAKEVVATVNPRLRYINHPISFLSVSERTLSVLQKNSIYHLNDLVVLTEVELLRLEFRKSEVTILKDVLADLKLSLGMKL